MGGLYNHLKRPVGFDGRQAGGQQFVKDHNVVLQRETREILERWERLVLRLALKGKTPKLPTLNPCFMDGVKQRPMAPATGGLVHLGSTPTPEETRVMATRTGGLQLDGAWSSLLIPFKLNIDSKDDEPIVVERFHAILVDVCGMKGEGPWHGKSPPSRCSTRSRPDPTG